MSCSACDRITRIAEGRNPDFVATLSETHVLLADEQAYRGYCLLFLKDHHEALDALPLDRQARVWEDVARVAGVVRRECAPLRINYACLGNFVTHVHWHVIPRYADDADTKIVLYHEGFHQFLHDYLEDAPQWFDEGLGDYAVHLHEDALEFFLAGASAVQIGTMSFVDPGVFGRTRDGLEEYCRRHRVSAIAELTGALDAWDATADGTLAKIVVLDQFTRNAFRGTARSFAGDVRALVAARALVANGRDRALPGVRRQFVYLPFEHAEDRATQEESMRLFRALAADEPSLTDLVTWADRHRAIVARFGRFPHRNAILGRASTPEEETFLREPGSSF